MVFLPFLRIHVTKSELRKLLVTLLCCLLVVIWLLLKTFSIETCLNSRSERSHLFKYNSFKLVSNYNRNTPLIFVGGVPRSGTTLMRAMLDAHPSVRCGEETRLIPRIIHSRSQWKKSHLETQRLKNAGMTDEIIDDALASFILEIVVKHGKPAPHLCNKDPLVLVNTTYVKNLFPNAKFLLMIRDGRASVHSMISRKVGVGTYNLSNYEQSLSRWSEMIGNMHEQCVEAGPQSCLPVYYEQLVLHPKKIMTIILEFLGIDWNDAVLEHENFIGNEIALSKMERSTDQVIKPINTDALTSWVGHIPEDLLPRMNEIAPMLKKLGYDPTANPPNYGKPDEKIIENTKDVKMNEKYWLRIAKKYSNLVKERNED